MSKDKPVPVDHRMVPSRRGYMGLTDFFWELGQTTTKTYFGVDALASNQSKCIEECSLPNVQLQDPKA